MQNESKQAQPGKNERYRQIAAVVAKHGLGAAGSHSAEHVRMACEELGTTFIKLGQMLSTRADLLPESYRVELAKLQDSVPPIDPQAIEDVIVAELGASPELIFSWFDRNPIGCASIAQVHPARTLDGRAVVVKVQKPDARAIAETDLQILNDLVAEWSERLPVLREYDAERLVQDFADTLRAELDYKREAANLRAFHEQFDTDPAIELPECLTEWSAGRVLTLTRLDGTKPQDIPVGTAGATIAPALARFVVEPAFDRGIFHADPHGGNFLITPRGKLAAMDFGMVARLGPDARRKLADVFVAIDRRDAQRLADRVIDIAPPSRPADRTVLTSEIERLLERYADASVGELRFGNAIAALLDLVREHRLRLPGNFAQFFKALVMCEGLLQAFDPQASLSKYLKPAVKKALLQRFGGDDWAGRAQESAADAADLAMELPRRVDRVLGEIERGNLRVWARLDDMESLMTRFERTAERTNATLLAAACIVAISIVMLFYHPQGVERWIGVVFWIAVALAFLHVVRTLLALRK